MNLIDKYLGEEIINERFKPQIRRTAWPEKVDKPPFDPYKLEWRLINSNRKDRGVNIKHIEDVAYKELIGLKRKGVLDFYESDFNAWSVINKGYFEYTADVKLKSYNPEKLTSELKKLKFYIVKNYT